MNTSFRFSCALIPACLAFAATAGTVTTAVQDRALFAEFSRQYARAGACAVQQPGFAEALAPALKKWRVRNEAALRLGHAFTRAETTQPPAEALAEVISADTCKSVLAWLESA